MKSENKLTIRGSNAGMQTEDLQGAGTRGMFNTIIPADMNVASSSNELAVPEARPTTRKTNIAASYMEGDAHTISCQTDLSAFFQPEANKRFSALLKISKIDHSEVAQKAYTVEDENNRVNVRRTVGGKTVVSVEAMSRTVAPGVKRQHTSLMEVIEDIINDGPKFSKKDLGEMEANGVHPGELLATETDA